MLKKIFSILNKDFNINQAAFLLGFFAFLSQIIGLVRDRSLANYIGPSSTLDIYYAAFRVPDFIFISIASLASFTVLIPFLIHKLKDGDHESARNFLSNIFSIFLLTMIAVSLVAFFLMPYLAKIIAPGFSAESIAKLVTLSRIMLLSPIFLGLTNFFGTVTQVFNKFFIYALSPILYNVGILLGILVFFPMWGMKGLAFGVVFGALLHFLIQVPAVIQQKFIPKFSFSIDFKEIKNTVLLSLPRTIGLVANNLAIIAILAMASLVSEGSISIFNLSFNIQTVPVSIIGVSYSVAVFPILAKFFSKGERDNFVKHIISAAKNIIFWSMPLIFLFIVLRAQIVRVILGSSRFSWSDTKLTAAALALFSVSVLAQSLTLLLVRGYYAADRTKRPLYVNIFFSLLSIFLAYVFLGFYKHMPHFQVFIQSLLRVEDNPGTAVLMLPLAYSIGTILNFFVLWRLFRQDFLDTKISNIGKTFFTSLISSFIIGVVAYKALDLFDNFLDTNTFWGILGQGFFSGVLGIIAGIIVLRLLKSPELEDAWKTIRTKFWNAPVIASAQEEL